ncbi:MAG: BT4734/BF3469 family protein, partial [Bacteroidota bacterium]
MNFSYFKPPVTSNITPLKTMDLRNVWMIILSDELKAVTQKVRSGKASKTDILPFITASGQFRKRNLQDLITYSGIISIDLDNCDIGMKNSLENDPFLQPSLIFVSPSGTGLKLFYQLAHADSSLHLTYFNAITTWLKEHYLLSAD